MIEGYVLRINDDFYNRFRNYVRRDREMRDVVKDERQETYFFDEAIVAFHTETKEITVVGRESSVNDPVSKGLLKLLARVAA